MQRSWDDRRRPHHRDAPRHRIATRTVRNTDVSEIVGLITGAVRRQRRGESRTADSGLKPEDFTPTPTAYPREENPTCVTLRAPSSRMALAAPAVLGFAGIADAQDKFKLGMAVGGNTCCEWMKFVATSPAPSPSRTAGTTSSCPTTTTPPPPQERPDLRPGRRRRRHPVQRPALVQPGDLGRHEAGRHPDRHLRHRRPRHVLRRYRQLAPALPVANSWASSSRRSGTATLISSSRPRVPAPASSTSAHRGMCTGVKNICPDIPAEKWVSFEGSRRCRRPPAGPRPARRTSRCQEDGRRRPQ